MAPESIQRSFRRWWTVPTDQLPHLETFAEAAERGGFTAAARALGLTQSAVSQRIQQLEKSVGAPLFRRAGGRVALTEAGRRLHGYARQIIGLHAEARSAVTGAPGAAAGELTLAASSVPGQHLLPRMLAAFRGRYPGVAVRVSVSDTAEALRKVEHGQAHLGLVGDRGGGPYLEFRRFACDRLVLVTPANGPWPRRRRVAVEELLRLPLIQREAGSGSRRCLERALDRVGLSPTRLTVALELGSNEAIKEAVLQGLGVAVLSRRTVEAEVAAGRLRAVPVAGLTLDRDMLVTWDRRRGLPPPAQRFLAQIHPAPTDPV
jgi:DNA-binding transcriptional LysR family regulator